MGGTAGALEVILFITGVLCILAEVFLIPGFGIPGIMGIALVLLSLVMATLDFVVPSSSGQWTQLSSGLLMVVTAFLIGERCPSRVRGPFASTVLPTEWWIF